MSLIKQPPGIIERLIKSIIEEILPRTIINAADQAFVVVSVNDIIILHIKIVMHYRFNQPAFFVKVFVFIKSVFFIKVLPAFIAAAYFNHGPMLIIKH